MNMHENRGVKGGHLEQCLRAFNQELYVSGSNCTFALSSHTFNTLDRAKLCDERDGSNNSKL